MKQKESIVPHCFKRSVYVLLILTLGFLSACASNDPPITPQTNVTKDDYSVMISIDPNDSSEVIQVKYGGRIVSWQPEAGFAVLGLKEDAYKTLTKANPDQTFVAETNEDAFEAPIAQANGSGAWASGSGAWASGSGAWASGSGAWASGVSSWARGDTSIPPTENHDIWQQIDLFRAHAYSPKLGEGITIAIIDTGADLNHPVFEGRLADPTQHKDFIDRDITPQDSDKNGIAYGHGTAVAGVLAQIAPKANLLPLRVLEADGTGDLTHVIEGISWAIKQNVDIINLSLGTAEPSKALKAIVNRATQQGIFVISAAGNSSSEGIDYPAASARALTDNSSFAISVGSVDSSDVKSSFSSYGASLEVLAPADPIFTTLPDEQITNASGTSFATPIISGLLALALAEDAKDLSSLGKTLTQTAFSIDEISGNEAFTKKLGWGRVNGGLFLKRALDIQVDGIKPNNDAYSLSEDATLTVKAPGVLANDLVDFGSLTVNPKVLVAPSHGALTLFEDGSFSYKHDGSEATSDSFTYEVTDGFRTSEAIVELSISAVNDAPKAQDQQLVIDEDNTLSIVLSAADADNQDLNFSLESDPQHGSLSGELPSLSYTPRKDFSGSDQFQYKVSDGDLSSIGTIFIEVKAINDPPQTSGQSLTLNEDNSLTVTLTATDSDSSKLNFRLTEQALNGSLSDISQVTNSSAELVYTPNLNYAGDDAFGFEVCDDKDSCSSALVSLVIMAENDAPKLSFIEDQIVKDGTFFELAIQATDIESNTLGYAVSNLPSGLSIHSSGIISGTLTANQLGTHTITITAMEINDTSKSSSQTFKLHILRYAPSPFIGQVIISEVLFKQSANDVPDEFIELYNTTDSAIDISEWEVLDFNRLAGESGGLNGKLEQRDDLLKPNHHAIIWTTDAEENSPHFLNDGVTLEYLGDSDNSPLRDAGDDVWLLDSQGRIVDFIAYGGASGHHLGQPPVAIEAFWDSRYQLELANVSAGQSISLSSYDDAKHGGCWEPTTSGDAGFSEDPLRCTTAKITVDTDSNPSNRRSSAGKKNIP